ncbi:hypothetical protein AB1K56_11780 [Microbacterium sp. BWR-S6Y]
MDGFYDCLTIEGKGLSGSIQFNRSGSVHVLPSHTSLLRTEDLLSVEGPRKAIRLIERAAGLREIPKARPSGARVLTYLVIARALQATMNDFCIWDVRSLSRRPEGYAHVVDADQKELPMPKIFTNRRQFEGWAISSEFLGSAQPGSLWVLLRNQEVVAVLDVRGVVTTAAGATSLPLAYSQGGRRLTRLVDAALGAVLP